MSNWETELAELLRELSGTQTELLAVITQKRQYMAVPDADGMSQLEDRERQLGDRLQACHERRGELLRKASDEGLPSESLSRLAAAMPQEARDRLGSQVQESKVRSRLLQHQSLTNWVLAQRTLLHLSQLLEIIASGGRLKPTYGRGDSIHARGALVDREA
jgi:hypothetical protein